MMEETYLISCKPKQLAVMWNFHITANPTMANKDSMKQVVRD